jgi:CorA-like Mg2+ transporter protein
MTVAFLGFLQSTPGGRQWKGDGACRGIAGGYGRWRKRSWRATVRLADVATIFLPISFLAGFWGQNFDVLTGSIEKGWSAFLVLGVGLSVACVLVIVFMLSRRSWK